MTNRIMLSLLHLWGVSLLMIITSRTTIVSSNQYSHRTNNGIHHNHWKQSRHDAAMKSHFLHSQHEKKNLLPHTSSDAKYSLPKKQKTFISSFLQSRNILPNTLSFSNLTSDVSTHKNQKREHRRQNASTSRYPRHYGPNYLTSSSSYSVPMGTKSTTPAFLIPPLFLRELSLRWKKHFDKGQTNSTHVSNHSPHHHSVDSGTALAATSRDSSNAHEHHQQQQQQARIEYSSSSLDSSLGMSVSNQGESSNYSATTASTSTITTSSEEIASATATTIPHTTHTTPSLTSSDTSSTVKPKELITTTDATADLHALESTPISPSLSDDHAAITQEKASPVHIIQTTPNEHEQSLTKEDSTPSESSSSSPSTKNNMVTLHSFYYPPWNITLYGLNLSTSRFKSWIQYLVSVANSHGQERTQGSSDGSNSQVDGAYDEEYLHGLLPSFTPSSLSLALLNQTKDTTASDVSDPSTITSQKAQPSSDITAISASKGAVPLLTMQNMDEYISTQQINADSEEMRKYLRQEWVARRLISDRTGELLASYRSDKSGDNTHQTKKDEGTEEDVAKKEEVDKESTPKRGNFHDLLSVYSNRLVSMLKEERNDLSCLLSSSGRSIIDTTASASSTNSEYNITSTLPWLEQVYGKEETSQLTYVNFSKVSQDERRIRMQHFLDWFRSNFPYYYDRCDFCGSSYREARQEEEQSANEQEKENDDDVVADEKSSATSEIDKNHDDTIATTTTATTASTSDNTTFDAKQKNEKEDEESNEDCVESTGEAEGSFVGYMYPSTSEASATRTELYQCHKCNQFTRFPRYNSIQSIIQYQRGRCGEYSILLYRLLRDLGHDARWVVDWADHVWAEFWMDDELNNGDSTNVEDTLHHNQPSNNRNGGRWIHLDPCEAAFDNPLLYHDWGKKQTFIVAFWAPPQNLLWGFGKDYNREYHDLWIEDVTRIYTRDERETIDQRRDESDDFIQSSLREVETELKKTLRDNHFITEQIASK